MTAPNLDDDVIFVPDDEAERIERITKRAALVASWLAMVVAKHQGEATQELRSVAHGPAVTVPRFRKLGCDDLPDWSNELREPS